MKSAPIFKLQFDESQLQSYGAKYPAAQDDEVMEAGRSAQQRGWMTRPEFLMIAKWKSPRPTKWYEANSQDFVEGVSKTASQLKSEVEKVLHLTSLSGVRVRTATALLHICYPDRYPLLDFRAMVSLGSGVNVTDGWDELDWLRIWPAYCRVCRELSAKNSLSLRQVDRALWVGGEP